MHDFCQITLILLFILSRLLMLTVVFSRILIFFYSIKKIAALALMQQSLPLSVVTTV